MYLSRLPLCGGPGERSVPPGGHSVGTPGDLDLSEASRELQGRRRPASHPPT